MTNQRVLGFKNDAGLKKFVACYVDKLKSPKRWLQGAAAETKHSVEVSPRDKTAVRFCLLGARDACSPTAFSRETDFLFKAYKVYAAQNKLPLVEVTFNDAPTTTYADIRRFLNYLKGLVA